MLAEKFRLWEFLKNFKANYLTTSSCYVHQLVTKFPSVQCVSTSISSFSMVWIDSLFFAVMWAKFISIKSTWKGSDRPPRDACETEGVDRNNKRADRKTKAYCRPGFFNCPSLAALPHGTKVTLCETLSIELLICAIVENTKNMRKSNFFALTSREPKIGLLLNPGLTVCPFLDGNGWLSSCLSWMICVTWVDRCPHRLSLPLSTWAYSYVLTQSPRCYSQLWETASCAALFLR